MAAIIETERLTKSYGEHRGIIDLDLAVGEGEVFGFLGRPYRRSRAVANSDDCPCRARAPR